MVSYQVRKRSIIETINDQLENISQIAHTRHHSVTNFPVNFVAGLLAYSHQPKKQSLILSAGAQAFLSVCVQLLTDGNYNAKGASPKKLDHPLR